MSIQAMTTSSTIADSPLLVASALDEIYCIQFKNGV
jgi:hypothetical protein